MLPYSAAHSKALGGGRAFKPSRHKSWTTHPREITKNSANFASSKRSTPERGMASARQSLCGATRRIRSIIARNVRGRSMIWGGSEEHTSELQSNHEIVCRLVLEKKKSS